MFTHRNPLMTHGSIFRNETTKQTCQIVCVGEIDGQSQFILANYYPFPFEIIREWDMMSISRLQETMNASDDYYRYMGSQPYYAEAEEK